MKYLATFAWGVGVNYPKQLLETVLLAPKEADLNATFVLRKCLRTVWLCGPSGDIS